MTGITHSNYVPENLEEFTLIEFELYDNVPYNEEKSQEEQVFFCLGHYTDTDYVVIKKIIAVDNISKDKSNNFEVSEKDYEKWKNLLIGIIHTHPQDNNVFPSDEDIKYLPKDIFGGIYQPITNHITWWNGYKLDL
jgi:proteasome lid subunit RPN8/RPN11